MSSVTIRKARASDAGNVVAMVGGGFEPGLVDATIYGCSGIARYVAAQISIPEPLADTRYFLAQTDGRPTGCIEVRLTSDGLFLNYVSVLGPDQSKGVGRRLLQSAILGARRSHHRLMRLDVLETNERAWAWYRRLGFAEEGVIEWWKLPLAPLPSAARGVLVGYPQAEAAHREFGFSSLAVVTPSAEHRVGRIGTTYFRVTSRNALADEVLRTTLGSIGGSARLLAILPRDPTASTMSPGEPYARFRRLRIPLEDLVARLCG